MKHLWDKIQDDTKLNRNVCKSVVYAKLYSSDLLHICCEHGLSMSDVQRITASFDAYTELEQ